jgi:hypothetical protein
MGAAEREHARAETNALVEAARGSDAETTFKNAARRICSLMPVGSYATHAGWCSWGGLPTAAIWARRPVARTARITRRAATCRSHGYLRQSERTAGERRRSSRTGGGCDLMRAQRRRWQIRVRAGVSCELRWHARSLNRVTRAIPISEREFVVCVQYQMRSISDSTCKLGK